MASRLFIVIAALGIPLFAANALSAQAKKEPAAKDDAKGKSLFDGTSLTGWKSAGYIGGGKVSVKDGAIVMEKGKYMTGVKYARGDFPKMDYEVTLEGKKLAGNDFFCTTTFPVGDAFCSLVVGGWGGQVIGLSSLNNMDASENDTTTSKEFKQDQWYKVKIRVTKDRIACWIDGKHVIDADTTDTKVSIRFECDNCKPFGFCTWDTVGAVRDIRVRMLTAAEKKAAAEKK
ncbi:MAG: DUF1080 domain-containing protein [Gemmataceae bacterium]|nr:DUF1080 domain-containing protein [Gemmataceae bacterium]